MINTVNRKIKIRGKIFLTCIFIFIIIVTMSKFSDALQITEIMFNPSGSDTGREWIELRINENHTGEIGTGRCINLTSYKLFEAGVNHNIYPADYNLSEKTEIFCKYAIISNDPLKFLQDYPELAEKSSAELVIYRSVFSLSNSGEELAIRNSYEILDYINYSMLLQYITLGEGYSLELSDNIWMKSSSIGGSPGVYLYANNNLNTSLGDLELDSEDVNNINHTTDTSYIPNSSNMTTTNNATNTSDEISNIKYNNTLNITYDTTNNTTNNITHNTTYIISNNLTNLSVFLNYSQNNNQNITQNLNFSSNNTHNITNIHRCNVSLKIFLKNTSMDLPYIHKNDIQIKFYNKIQLNNNQNNNTLKGMNYSIEYWVEDVLGNIIKNKVITSNQEEKSFTPKIKESDNILIIKSSIKNIDCDINTESDSKILLIRHPEYQSSEVIKCNITQTKCEPCMYNEGKENVTSSNKSSSIISQINSQMPLIKIVNVCNNSNISTGNSKTSKNILSNEEILTTQSTLQLTSLNTQSSQTEKSPTENSQKSENKVMTTGMIVYESPNLKNRFYAIIGMILVGLTFITLGIYKKFGRYWYTKKDEQASSEDSII
jgi:hypothetical protein